MSARDRLWALYQTPDTASAFGEALDAYAHELAEQIRAKAKGCSWGPCQACEVRLEDARLIDPEVLNSGG